MRFDITGRDENGRPTHVCTDDGFMQTSRPYDDDSDGWMESQLDRRDFIAIEMGRMTEALVNEVNRLRRDNFRLQKQLDMWTKAR